MIQEIKVGETIKVRDKYFVCVGIEDVRCKLPRVIFVSPEELLDVAEKTRA